MPLPTHPADALKRRFRDVFGCRGRVFGILSRGVPGISDGSEGVQWNAGYRPPEGAVRLGVNLEGMKHDDCLIARLIERELSRPLLLTRYRGWEDALRGARECLNPRKRHRGRGNVPVSLLPSKRRPWERQVEMDASPRLRIETPLAEITLRAMRQARDDLEALYGFAADRSRP